MSKMFYEKRIAELKENIYKHTPEQLDVRTLYVRGVCDYATLVAHSMAWSGCSDEDIEKEMKTIFGNMNENLKNWHN